MQRKRPNYQVIDGVARCPGITLDKLSETLDFRAKEGDLVQSTFPKSGTNWLMYITHLILREGEPMTKYQDFCKEWRFIEYMNIKDFTSRLPLRTFVTHFALDKRMMTAEGKYVYMARNPWDLCVSFYHMANTLYMYHFRDGTFEDFADTFVSGNFGYGDYFEHVAAGYALRKEPNVLFCTYEELKNNTREVALKLAYFLGEKYGRALEDDESLLQKLLERSQADNMRKVVVLDLTGKDNPQWNDMLSRRRIPSGEAHTPDRDKYAFVRSGKVGSWKDYFTPDLLRKMENRILEVEKKSPVMDLWKDIRADAIKLIQDTE